MIEFEQLKQLVAQAQEEVEKYDQGNKAAGTRVRKAMQEIKQAAQAVREKVLQARAPQAPPAAPPPAAGPQ